MGSPLPTLDLRHSHRKFLGWDAPALPAAVTELVNRYRADRTLDLRSVVVVVPGQRAGRRLRELLVDAADRDRLLLTPPEVVTEGRLPELLYQTQKPFATALVQQLAWTAALRALAPSQRMALLPYPPGGDDSIRWFRVGQMLGRVDAELAADGHDVDAVLREGGRIEGFADRERWEAVRAARDGYHTHLNAQGMWDKHAARLVAVQRREIASDRDIILIGMADLNAVVRQMLAQVAGRVTTLIVAPEDRAAGFDEFGTLVVSEWTSALVPLNDEHIRFVDGPAEQTSAMLRWLAELDSKFAIEEVAIGVPDPTIVPTLRRHLRRNGLDSHWVEERTLKDTSPYRLLETASEYVGGCAYDEFAALLRHPHVDAWLRRFDLAPDLTALDAYHDTRLPIRIDEKSVPETEVIHPIVRRVCRWLADATVSRPLREWAAVFEKVLRDVYDEDRDLALDHDGDRVFHDALRGLLAGLEDLRRVPEVLDLNVPAADAFVIAFEVMAADPLPAHASVDALELLGWLELPLDDAPAVLVTTFNDGFVPSAAGADSFLPDALRQRLGLECDDRRYARDAYAATVLARSKRQFAVVVARRDTEQNPLLPSRLLFACAQQDLVTRADRWRRAGENAAVVSAEGEDVRSPFSVPDPRKTGRKADHFRVTEFRDYLACPYRYYLKHVEKLRAVDDAARELDGGAFGGLLHEVLQAWGNDQEWRHCGDADALAAHLKGRLDSLAAIRFSGGRPAVGLQLIQAGRRLASFARRQADLVTQGWRIVFAEQDRSLSAPLVVDDGEVTLVGRIDRIDYCADKNAVRVIDYKTGDTAVRPENAHQKKGEWTDLQLPLYRHLWRSAALTEAVPETAGVDLCYFQIPNDPRGVELVVAEWDAGTLADAEDECRRAIRHIRGEKFDMVERPPPYFEEFAAICLDHQQAPGMDDEEAGEL